VGAKSSVAAPEVALGDAAERISGLTPTTPGHRRANIGTMSAVSSRVAATGGSVTATPTTWEPTKSVRFQATVIGIGIVLAILSEWSWSRASWVTPQLIVLDVLTYGTYVVTGTIAWARRPSNPLGKLLVASGFASFISGFWAFDQPILSPIGMTFQVVGSVILYHTLLAYPTGHLRGWFDRGLVALAYAGWVGIGLVIAISASGPSWYGCGTGCDAGPVIGSLDTATVQALGDLRNQTYLPFAVVLIAVMVTRWIRGSAVARRIYGPVLLATIAYNVAALISNMSVGLDSEVVWYAAQAMIPVTMLFGLLRLRLVRGGVGGLVLELRAASTQEGLQEALRRALRDPSLELRRVDPASGQLVDGQAQPAEMPTAGPDRGVILLERSGRLLGALVHDPGLIEERELLESASEAASLALENAWLQDELRRQLEEVRASRARIVAAGDAERRRVERDLHDGAQQRLVDVALAIGEAQSQLRSGNEAATGQTLSEASEGLRAALAELRELARGIHPAILTEEGLDAAVTALAARSRVPVRVSTGNVGRLPPTVEATTYFVVAESLANVAKHAEAGSVRVTMARRDGVVEVEIADDGRGGADASKGSGLRGIDDRAAALGGHLSVMSELGEGTRIRVEIPCE
jgi:signal transduction histidine kinase